MWQRINPWWWALVAVLGVRWIAMAIMPLADTSEPRYAEIARLMAASGDWITPWFEPDVPFWGKPPLAFWFQAGAIKVLGTSEFAVRLPSWLATVAVLALIHALARNYYGARAARFAVLIYSTCLLPFISAGAVLTDPFLVLGTTWSMVGFALARSQPRWWWRYGFFAGLGLALLAKGPLALVLAAGALVPWLLWHRDVARAHLRALPWFSGLLLLVAIAVPWYVAAENKTPGFLNYFLVGEHFLRFIDPGWAGDRYGSAHERLWGSIWFDWLQASFPWGLVALWCLVNRDRMAVKKVIADKQITYLTAWSLFTLVFFTFSGNILWTYVLPALPAFAILLAGYFERRWSPGRLARRAPATMVIVPISVLFIAVVTMVQPERLKTEKALVSFVQKASPSSEPLLYVDRRPFSARYYSQGRVEMVSLEALPERLADAQGPVHLAVPKGRLEEVEQMLSQDLQPRFKSRRYTLVTVYPGVEGKQVQTAPAGSSVSRSRASSDV